MRHSSKPSFKNGQIRNTVLQFPHRGAYFYSNLGKPITSLLP